MSESQRNPNISSRKTLAAVAGVILLLLIPQLAPKGQHRTDVQSLSDFEARMRSEMQKRRPQRYYDLLNSKDPAAKRLNDHPDIQLVYIDQVGRPVYYKTDNIDAARTISTDDVWSGGSSGHELDGSGTLLGELGMWDAGSVRTTHQELYDRVTDYEPSTISDHATHVAGTIIAAGIDANAKGMSPAAYLVSRDYGNDFLSMFAAALDGMLLSNHSYSIVCGWALVDTVWYWFGDVAVSTIEDAAFGYYTGGTAQWDGIVELLPNYLIVKSAGNDRNDQAPPSGTEHYHYDSSVWQWVLSTDDHPDDGWPDGYDCIPPHGSAKNILTVGAVMDIPSGYSQPSDVILTTFSSWGPSDDGRIKPDIVANGYNVWSCSGDSNSDYQFYSGTSMSAPSVTGSVNLLRQYYEDTHGDVPPRSATLKSLVICTADEAGPDDGPDYQYGWGLMNTKKAADFIAADVVSPIRLREDSLANGEVEFLHFMVMSPEDVRVTMVWTDPPTTDSIVGIDPTTPQLVNDLDLRIVNIASQTTYFPWKLDGGNPSAPATRGDNVIDNVESIDIKNAEVSVYLMSIEHKGTLTKTRDYSLCSTVPFRVGPVAPEIESISDVNNDQGKQVRIVWHRAMVDAVEWTGAPVTSYSIWRRIDVSPARGLTGYDKVEPAGAVEVSEEWDLVSTIPASGESTYSAVVPTLCDSTSSGICWSTMFVRAHTDIPTVKFDSQPDSGYSVDNLVPSAPQGVFISRDAISWDPVGDEDIDLYTIYAVEDPANPSETAALVGETTENTFTLPAATKGRYLFVTAVDASGNVSPPSERIFYSGTTSRVLPATYSLMQNIPNPFNPTTTIHFDIPAASNVSLHVYDTAGRLVKTLVNHELPRSRYTVEWDGRDERGRLVASGVYFYRLVANDFIATRKMILIK
jgi:hypothetical protein